MSSPLLKHHTKWLTLLLGRHGADAVLQATGEKGARSGEDEIGDNRPKLGRRMGGIVGCNSHDVNVCRVSNCLILSPRHPFRVTKSSFIPPPPPIAQLFDSFEFFETVWLEFIQENGFILGSF
jgi:hypothetical protein